MNIKQLTHEVVKEINVDNERELKSKVKGIIRSIISEQDSVKIHQERIKDLQKSLKELKIETVSEDVIG